MIRKQDDIRTTRLAKEFDSNTATLLGVLADCGMYVAADENFHPDSADKPLLRLNVRDATSHAPVAWEVLHMYYSCNESLENAVCNIAYETIASCVNAGLIEGQMSYEEVHALARPRSS